MIAELGLTRKLTVSYHRPCLLLCGIWPVLAGRSKATTSCQVQSFKGTGSTDHPWRGGVPCGLGEGQTSLQSPRTAA